jgi:hypothetical protein
MANNYVGYGAGPGGGWGYPVAVPVVKPRQQVGATISANPSGAGVSGGGLGTGAKLGTGQIGSGGSGGSNSTTTTTIMTPNQVYQDEILADPGSVAAMGTFSAQTNQLAAARADAIQRAIINSGYTPQMTGGLASYASDVTPGTLSAAAANPMSQQAQLNLQLQQASQNLPYQLAATGAGRSGAAAIEQGNLQRQYQTSQYQGMQDLLGQLYGAGNTYAGGYNTALSNLDAARAAVANRLAQTAGYSQSITTTGGDGGGGGDGGINPDIDPTTGLQLGANVPSGGTSYGSYAASPAYAANPSTKAAVQRVINAIKQPSPRVGQTLRNVMAG